MINLKPISGFYENLPDKQIIEEKFKEIIKNKYSLSGFTPLDTPNIERVETLTSKGADDNEIYGIKRLKAEGNELNNFDFGLRFDLTVPLARYISQYEGELTFPFKRQHIGRVYRGERPQKGRYREFYQADIDIIGNGKLPLFADVEILSTIYNALNELGFGNFIININNKKLLVGFLESIGIVEIVKTIGIIDKKDKVSFEKLRDMFLNISLNEFEINNIEKFIILSNEKSSIEILEYFKDNKNELLIEGLKELTYLYENLLNLGVDENYIKINPSISRGLNYYTGTVFETFIEGYESIGSISSGGRYEDLASNFSKNNFPGVGGSIGLSRLLFILDNIGKLEFLSKTVSKVMVVNMGDELLKNNLEIVTILRNIGINTELYIDGTVKIQKQLKYAHNKKIPFVIIQGEDEYKKGIIQFKNLENNIQLEIKLSSLEEYILTIN